eukprot:92598-Amorphochlora_amoeboformis.AAC.2
MATHGEGVCDRRHYLLIRYNPIFTSSNYTQKLRKFEAQPTIKSERPQIRQFKRECNHRHDGHGAPKGYNGHDGHEQCQRRSLCEWGRLRDRGLSEF